MSLIEAALAPPTAIALSRLVSRSRIHEADARAVELTEDRAALISTLQKLDAAGSPVDPWLARRRFSLFVASEPVVGGGYRGWIARLYTTHPSTDSRLETLAREAAGAELKGKDL
jgi:Zn-dependent protease with chaperone function